MLQCCVLGLGRGCVKHEKTDESSCARIVEKDKGGRRRRRRRKRQNEREAERQLEYSGNEKSSVARKREAACTRLQKNQTIIVSFKDIRLKKKIIC